uniref:protein-tyrosine-phosphatase n=1 Tax=Glossina morsitans morsitans TaxID=37546 RepID=A0A1B0FHQ2_GLOMM
MRRLRHRMKGMLYYFVEIRLNQSESATKSNSCNSSQKKPVLHDYEDRTILLVVAFQEQRQKPLALSSPRWFHPKISTIEAEKLLLEKGLNGSFLAHSSSSNPDAFTLSVRKDQEVIHIGIQNTGYFLHLDSDEIFATLTELVQFYMKVGELKKEDGEVIKLKQPLLRTEPFTGRFLHRNHSGSPGDVSSSVRTNDKVRHAIMDCQSDKDDLLNGGDNKYNGLVEARRAKEDLPQLFNAARVATTACVRQLVKDSFCQEFESLSEGSSDKLYCQEGYKLENRNKNRYCDILPHDHTRVKLIDVDHSIAGADYINANYICLPLDNLYANFHATKANPPTTHALAHLRKSCATGQLFRKGLKKAQRTVATASLSVNNCITCSKKSNMFCKHRHSESVLIASNMKNLCAVRSLSDTSISNANNGNTSLVGKEMLCKNLSSDLAKRERLKTYIATQGCLPNTIIDFWNMIWQENTRIIVMITREIERGKSKCAKYWTKKGEIKQFGPAKIHCISKDSSLGDYILREFLVSWRDQTERHIYHYHFQAWPDHGVPTDPDCVLDFLNDLNTKQNQFIQAGKEPGPICVHCSAGIGRTGTLIIIDMILDQIDKHGVNIEIDIKRTIQMVRSQRSGLVQTEAQHKFIYCALQRYIQRICKKY